MPVALRMARNCLVAAPMEWWISVSLRVCYGYGVRRFRSIQKLNSDDFDYGAMVLRARADRKSVV